MDPIISFVEGKREEEEEEEEDGEVVCRMVVGNVLVEKMRRETAAACGFQIRALSGDDASPFAFPPDDNVNQLIQITGRFSAVKNALLLVSSSIHDSPTVDAVNINVTKPIWSCVPWKSYACTRRVDSTEVMDLVFIRGDILLVRGLTMLDSRTECFLKRMLCLNCFAILRKLVRQYELCKMELVRQSSLQKCCLIQNSDQIHSPAQDGVMHVHARITEIGFEPGTAAMARLLVHSQQIGCLLGRGGHIIAEMRRATGASIRVFPKEQSSRHGSSNDEIVQVIGNLHSVHDALFHITSRLRETIFPMRPPFPDSGPPYMPPYPEMPPPPFRPRHNPGSPCPYPSPVAHFRNIDHVPPPPLDHLPVFLHGMDHMGPNFDRVPHPYGSERHGHGSMYDRPPSPRSWTPQWNSCTHYYS